MTKGSEEVETRSERVALSADEREAARVGADAESSPEKAQGGGEGSPLACALLRSASRAAGSASELTRTWTSKMMAARRKEEEEEPGRVLPPREEEDALRFETWEDVPLRAVEVRPPEARCC